MTVEDDSDVTGETVSVEAVDEVSLVEAIEDTKRHVNPRIVPVPAGLESSPRWVARPFPVDHRR
jgi:hypothetical protein